MKAWTVLLEACWIVMMAANAYPVEAAPAEMEEAHQWASAKFEGVVRSEPPQAGIEVVSNHGVVQPNARGGKPMHLGGKEFTRGLYCHAPSQLVIRLPGPGKTFEAIAGIDSNDQTSGGRGSVVYSIHVRDGEIWKSETVREGMPGIPVSVDLGGEQVFSLEVGDGGDGISCDQADWLDAKATLQDGTVLWIGDLPIQGLERHGYTLDPFFSFTYGGRPSRELLPTWQVQRNTVPEGQRILYTLNYADPETGLAIECAGVRYGEFPTVEWVLHFRNTGKADTPIIENIQALDTRFERGADGEFLLHHFVGSVCAPNDYQPLETPLGPNAKKHVATTGGRPTNSDMPYFNIEMRGEGIIAAISWAGQWAADFERDAGNGLRVAGGQELTHFVLHPGEAVRTPMTVLQFYKGDWVRAQNVWRQWMLAHNQPRPGGKPLQPQASICNGNHFAGLLTNATDEMFFIQRYIDAGIKAEYWWQDAGWYPNFGDWGSVGTWEIDTKRFPKGIRGVSDWCLTKDIKTIVWFEPERVTAGTWIAENHPEWVHGGKNGGLLKLGEPECRAWLTDHIDTLLTEQGIALYRQDFNIDPLAYWRANDSEDRQGITEIRHVEGYFAYWDELLRRHPDMLIDSCASGGRRNDLETLRRAVPLLRSDYTFEPVGEQCHTYGLSFWIPFNGTGFIDINTYLVRSLMAPEFTLGVDMRRTDLKLDLLRKLSEEWRQVADYYFGDYYPLTPYSLANDAWMAWQFNRPDLGEGIVQAFRRANSCFTAAAFPLRGLDPDARYTIRNLDEEGSKESTGRELLDTGLAISMPEKPCATVFVYKRVK